MIHPLAEDFSNLKDLEIESKIQELSRKYWMTTNPNIQTQISLFLDLYRSELANRRARVWQEQAGKRNEDLDKLINVN
jgi:hypothetical protein